MGWLDPDLCGSWGYQGVNLEAIKGIGGGMGKSKARWSEEGCITQSGWSRVSDEEKRALKKVYKATKAKLS
ncbi:hypothetical protein H5410_033019 [Solanum commersonii]|uniref:Uncharacterized protein n=1 Tax=Solanum commersonii TaxID=4109 RepID=A0A9J5YML4_SOLCO|nr:hypothetical protein H5410_033019 [Solanum commersonii]